MGVSTEDQVHSFQVRNERQVGDFLGIRIETLGDQKFNLIQSRLTNNVLKTANVEENNSAPTPTSTAPLGIEKEGVETNEDWEYATVVVMLMYLAQNFRPDC